MAKKPKKELKELLVGVEQNTSKLADNLDTFSKNLSTLTDFLKTESKLKSVKKNKVTDDKLKKIQKERRAFERKLFELEQYQLEDDIRQRKKKIQESAGTPFKNEAMEQFKQGRFISGLIYQYLGRDEKKINVEEESKKLDREIIGDLNKKLEDLSKQEKELLDKDKDSSEEEKIEINKNTDAALVKTLENVSDNTAESNELKRNEDYKARDAELDLSPKKVQIVDQPIRVILEDIDDDIYKKLEELFEKYKCCDNSGGGISDFNRQTRSKRTIRTPKPTTAPKGAKPIIPSPPPVVPTQIPRLPEFETDKPKKLYTKTDIERPTVTSESPTSKPSRTIKPGTGPLKPSNVDIKGAKPIIIIPSPPPVVKPKGKFAGKLGKFAIGAGILGGIGSMFGFGGSEETDQISGVAETASELATPQKVDTPQSGTNIRKLERVDGQLVPTTPAGEVVVGKTVAKEAAESAGTKGIRKLLGKGVLKAGGKTLAKKLPFGLGLAAAGAMAYDRYKSGDYVGAGLEGLSGITAINPGIGTGASLAIDAVSMARDAGLGNLALGALGPLGMAFGTSSAADFGTMLGSKFNSDKKPNLSETNEKSVKNSNVGNLRQTANTKDAFIGTTGFDESGFNKFETEELGTRALFRDINTKVSKGLNTPRQIIEKFAPASDGNDINTYLKNIKDSTGLGPDDAITTDTQKSQIVQAIAKQESGVDLSKKYTPDQLSKIQESAKIDDEPEVRRMLSDIKPQGTQASPIKTVQRSNRMIEDQKTNQMPSIETPEIRKPSVLGISPRNPAIETYEKATMNEAFKGSRLDTMASNTIQTFVNNFSGGRQSTERNRQKIEEPYDPNLRRIDRMVLNNV